MDNKQTFCSGNHILVGLGGTGGKILKAFKMRMFEEFSPEQRDKQPVALVYVDSTDEMMPKDGRAREDFKVMGEDASFTNNEFFNIKAVDVEYILDHINNYPTVRGIVDNAQAVKSSIGSIGQAAGQKRRAGRLLFAANAKGYLNNLTNAYAKCEAISGNSDKTTFYIFAGLSGGTGSGAIIDAVVQTRKQYPESKILVFAMMPEYNLPKADMDQGRYYQNGYAALNELNALQSGRWAPHDVTGSGPANLFNFRTKGVADGLSIYSNINENGLTVNSLKELPKIVSDYVFAKIYFVNDEDEVNDDIVRAYNFENMDSFALEYDENGRPDANGAVPVARTKKINSFGIKRVIYPELRILKHIIYVLGEKVLYQFKYNNWRENQGFVNEERNKDYRRDYLNKDNLMAWMLDQQHLTLEKKILESDTEYPMFADYWHDKAIAYAEEAKKADNPLNELDNILADFYTSHFREDGVENFYNAKANAIPEIAKEVRRNIEHSLFEKWRQGDISIIELKKVSTLLLERMGEIRKELDAAVKDENEAYKSVDAVRAENVKEWGQLGVLARMVGKGARLYAQHQELLTECYTSKTMIVALEFAKRLAARVFMELSQMDAEISAFGQRITDAIEETEKLITAQRKVNKGLEDMRGAIIEVCEDEAMKVFENDIAIDKIEMPNIARQIREAILPQREFISFGNILPDISVDDIIFALNTRLPEVVRTKHAEKVDPDKRVLGLNILSQLQQKLSTDDDIKAFAQKIVAQSGMFLKLNTDQMQLHLRNNEGTLSPTNPASVNKKAILVSIPSPEGNESLARFATKLEKAFKDSFNHATARTSIIVNAKSPRKDELSIVTVGYCFPMRAIEWMQPYKERYDSFLHTGNQATDTSNAILLHSEGDGSNYPSLFACEEIDFATQDDTADKNDNTSNTTTTTTTGNVGTGSMPPPLLSVYVAQDGRQTGPFDYAALEKKVAEGVLKPDTLVWKEGLSAWTPADQVQELKALFLPKMPPPLPGVPGMPPLPV